MRNIRSVAVARSSACGAAPVDCGLARLRSRLASTSVATRAVRSWSLRRELSRVRRSIVANTVSVAPTTSEHQRHGEHELDQREAGLPAAVRLHGWIPPLGTSEDSARWSSTALTQYLCSDASGELSVHVTMRAGVARVEAAVDREPSSR